MTAKRIEEIYALHGLYGHMARQLARAHEHVLRELAAPAAQKPPARATILTSLDLDDAPSASPPVAEAGENPSDAQQRISAIRSYWCDYRSRLSVQIPSHDAVTAFIRDLDRIAGSARRNEPAIVAAAKREAYEEAAKELREFLPPFSPLQNRVLVEQIANALLAKAASTGISLAPTPATAGEEIEGNLSERRGE